MTNLRNKELRHDEKGPRLAGRAQVVYAFHDYKASGIDKPRWKLGQECRMGNAAQPRRHHLSQAADADKDGLTKEAVALMLASTFMINGLCSTRVMSSRSLRSGSLPTSVRQTLERFHISRKQKPL